MSLKVLVVISDPIDEELASLSFVEEWQSIARAFAYQPIAVTLTRLFPPTIDNLFHTLHSHQHKFDILHFIGHGNMDGICLEDEVGAEAFIDAKELAQAVQESSIPLVVLNVCESENPASLLAAVGIQTVIGMVESIYDDAIMFARELYSNLAAGQSVEHAMERAREILRQIGGDDQIPIVFGDTSLRFSKDLSVANKVRMSIQKMPDNNLLYSGFFLGRHGEMRSGMKLIADPNCRVVQITGIGGVGKTAFCSQLAQRNAWRFFGGVLWLNGDRFTSSSLEELIISGARHVLKIEDHRNESTRDITDLNDVHALMNSRPVLIIIDDAERLPKNIIQDINFFLTRLDPLVGSKIIICSQIPIIDLEMHSSVGSIQLSNLDLASAIQLTQTQARLQNNIEIVLVSEARLKQILERVDCNPKMIQLTLGLSKAVGFEECKITIEELSGPMPQMLNILIGQIVNSLNPIDIKLLQTLTFFATFFNVEDIRGVFSSDSFQQSLIILCERNLISFDPFSEKYHIHNLVKDFVSSNTSVDFTYLENYSQYIVERLQYMLSLPIQEMDKEISSDIDRFLIEAKATVNHLQETDHTRAFEIVIQISNTVRDYLHFQRQDWKSISYFEHSAKNACGKLSNVSDLGSVLTSLAAAEVQMGNLDHSLDLCNKGIGYLSKLEDPHALSIGYGALGFILRKSGNLDESEEAYLMAQHHAHIAHSTELQIRHLSNLGTIYRQRQDLNKARDKYQEALDLARLSNDQSAIAMQLDLLGLLSREKQPEEALQLHQEAYNIKVTIGDRFTIGVTRNNLVTILKRLHRSEEALAYFDDISEDSENETDSLNNWYEWLQRARIYRTIHHTDMALTYYKKARDVAENYKFRRGISICERGIAICYKISGDIQLAYKHMQRSVEFSSLDDKFHSTLLKEMHEIEQLLAHSNIN